MIRNMFNGSVFFLNIFSTPTVFTSLFDTFVTCVFQFSCFISIITNYDPTNWSLTGSFACRFPLCYCKYLQGMTKQNLSGNVLHKLSYAESTNQDDQFPVWNMFILQDVVLDIIG